MKENDEYSTVNLSYAILRNDDPFKLEIEVIEYMEEGWDTFSLEETETLNLPIEGKWVAY